MALLDGVVHITEDQDEPQEDVEFFFRHHLAEQSDEDAVDRKGYTDIAKDDFRGSLPDADIGFPVILLHHFFDILHGTDFDLYRLGLILTVLFGHEFISSLA